MAGHSFRLLLISLLLLLGLGYLLYSFLLRLEADRVIYGLPIITQHNDELAAPGKPGNIELAPTATANELTDHTTAAIPSEASTKTTKFGSSNVTYDYHWDFHNLAMSNTECEVKFPHMFDEIERAVKRGEILGSPKKLDGKSGMMKVRIYDNKLYIIWRGGDVWHRQRAILHQLNRALITSPEKLPNIVFTFSVNDHPAPNAWSLTRSDSPKEIQETWLMPDFGAWSWPEPLIGTMEDIREKIANVEKQYSGWRDKIGKAIWRGSVHWNKDLRGKLLEVAGGEEQRDWADVQKLEWGKNNINIEDFCKYKFLIYTEGVTYSGRLRYFQHCRSLIFTPNLKWHQYYHPLISSFGPNQNIVEVKPDWSDLEEKIKYYRDIAPEEAEKIANNNLETFGKRYLSDAAEVCYWRKLIKGWDQATRRLKEEKEKGDIPLSQRGVSFESYVLMGELTWKQSA